ncbi:MAG: M20/M25/M40 family metallo-hydrolase [Planctomycetota bacterium]
MIELLLAAVAAVAVVPPPPLAEDPPAICAVFTGGDGDLASSLTRHGEVWHDAGEFLVGAFSPSVRTELASRGVEVVVVGPYDLSGDLWVIAESEVELLGGVLAPECTELLRAGGARLLRLPAGASPRGAGAAASRGRHTGLARIPRRAWSPGQPFAWRGRERAGDALARAGADPRIQALVDQVEGASLRETVVALSALFTRRSSLPEAIVARDMIRGWFLAYGLNPRLEVLNPYLAENVIAEIPGAVIPAEIVVIGAHYDSTNLFGPLHYAPGADDNASGTAGVLEAARILAAAGPYERTLRFIAFCGEEQGLIGSGVSAANSRAAGENIVAMLNTDMNAYRRWDDARTCDFVTNYTSSALRAFCQAAGALYVPDWASNTGSLAGGTSDHQSYYSQGYPAVFFFEDVGNHSPFIHTDRDTTAQSAIDWARAEMIVKAVLASAVAKAEIVGVQILHAPLADTPDAWGAHPVAAHVTTVEGATVTGVTLHFSSDGGQTFAAAPMSAAGGGSWTGAIPSFGAPITLEYYVTGADDQGASAAVPPGADLGGPGYSFFVGVETELYATGFEGPGDEGWTHGMLQTEDDWQRGVPGGAAGDAPLAYEGTSAWGNDLAGAYSANAWNWLRSPAVDCSAAANVTLRFRRWLTVEKATDDQAQILVNGVVVWENATGADTIDAAWTPVILDITSRAAGDPAVQIEFRLHADGGLQLGGWNIDDFALVERGAPSGNMFVFGSGINPAGSMILAGGTASIGETAIVAVHNPLGTQGAGTLAYLFVAAAPDPAYPAGTPLPGFGMAGPGADGELLISLAPPDLALVLDGGAWSGSPVSIEVDFPADPGLVGLQAYGQGLLLDPAAPGGVRFGLTEGVVFQIGG